MEIRKLLLYVALGITIFALWSTWQHDNQQKTQAAQQALPHTLPAVQHQAQHAGTDVPASRIVNVSTDTLDVAIDKLGGNVVRAGLPQYAISLDKPNVPIQILSDDPSKLYIAQSGIVGLQQKPLLYQAVRNDYTLGSKKELVVTLIWHNKDITVNKTFTFRKGSYVIDVDYKLANNSAQPFAGQFYTQIKRKQPTEKHGLFILHTYTGAAISSPQQPYEKISYEKMTKEDVAKTVTGGWVAMQQPYFLSAWVPEQNRDNHYYSHALESQVFSIGMTSAINIPAKQQQTINNKLYIGPEISDNLKPLAKGLDLTIDYGWLWFISVVLFWLMQHIYSYVGNWGWSIVIVTVLIRLAFFKLSEASYRSMAKLKTLAPKIKTLQERYKDDRTKLSQATMELYKKEKVNPLGGCLPQIIQIPVFIGLYYVLIEAVQLRHAPFIFWIHDLSVKDPFYILPILMGASMFLSQKLTPATVDPAQAKMMMFLPVVFTALFASFPSGLVLYWFMNNVLSVLQQWYIMRKYEKG